MKFSVDSWHYRLVEYVYGKQYFFVSDVRSFWRDKREQIRRNISLCKYFWSVVYALFIVVPTAVIRRVDGGVDTDATIGISTIFYVEGLIGLVASIATGVWFWLPVPWLTTLAFVGTVIGVVILKDKVKAWQMERWLNRSPPTPKGPNLFIETLKAKKSKVCPIIEWEDPSKALNAPTTPGEGK